jgi:bile acid:Na+ symporter, BASS family
MRALHRGLDYLGQHATLFLAGGVLLGLLVPQLAALARPLLIPGLLIPLVIALLRLDWDALAAYARRPGLVALISAGLLLVAPVLMWLVLKAFSLPPALVQGLTLMAAASPIVSGAAISMILGLDAALAVVVIVATTALIPFLLPTTALWLLGLQIDIDLPTFMLRLALMVGGTFATALALRRVVPRHILQANARMLDGASVATLMVFALGIMDGVTAVALSRPGYVLLVTLYAFCANILMQCLGTLVSLRLGMRSAITVGLLAGNCNMGLVMVALADKADFDLIVFFAMAQLPMYMLPALLRPVYRRLLASTIPSQSR